MNQFNAVLVDKEEACRVAAVSNLTEFGFRSSHIHGFEDVEEAVQKVQEVHGTVAQGQLAPVIVFIPSWGCSAFSKHKFRHQTFLVRTSDSATRVTLETADPEGCQCTVPKAFDQVLLRACSECFQAWLATETAKEERMRKFHERAALKRQARAGGGPRNIVSEPPREREAALTATAEPSATQLLAPTAAQPLEPPAAQLLAPPAGPLLVPQATQPLEPPAAPGAQPNCLVDQVSGLRFTGYIDLGNVVHTGLTPSSRKSDSNMSRQNSVSDRRNTLDALALLLPGRSPFEDVHILNLAGRGSFGSVYKARWDASVVALKVVSHSAKADTATVTFEGALSASLSHPNLVHTYKYSIRETVNSENEANGCEVWIVQEWCGLGTLGSDKTNQKILNRGGYLCVAEVCCEIASAASYLHSRGIVHGDLSGNNVLLAVGHCPKGFVAKVCDFGLARVLGDSDRLETSSMGTVSCMPPELFVITGAAITTKVDVYAFGIILWMLCSGEIPFAGKDPPQIVLLVARGKTLELPVDVPGPLVAVYKKSVARNPQERPNFQELVHDLLLVMKNADAVP